MADRSRYEDSYTSRNYGGTNTGVLDLTKINGSVNFYKPKEGFNKIDIVSYKIKGQNHPLVRKQKYKVGETDYRLDIYMHRKVGPSEASVVCPKIYGKACPICALSEEARREGKKDEAQALKAKRVVFYNVVDLEDPTKGIQIFQVSHPLFEHELIEEAKNSTEDGSYVDFANEKDGYSIQFRGSKTKAGTYEYLEFKGFKFIKRKDDISKMVDDAYSLDDLLTLHSNDQIIKLMNGDDEDEDIVVDEDDVPTPTRYNPKPEPEEEPTPVPATPPNPCPNGYKFGKDNDKYPECENCNPALWKECFKAGKK